MKKQKKIKRGLNNNHMYVNNEEEGIDEFFDMEPQGCIQILIAGAVIVSLIIWGFSKIF